MTETRPTGEQLRFMSAATGEHILDAYLEAAEKGGRQLPDLLADIFDASTGLFRADIFDFRVAADLKLQFRVGDFPDLVTGWRDVEGSPFLFFRPRGTWATSTQYAITDLVTYSNATYYALSAHTSTSTFDPTKWSLILDDAALDAAIASAQASASTATTQATNAATSAATANTRATNAQTSATAAAASQSAAATSATNAASSATTATTKASEASTSATAAASSASTATTQATNASTSATNAASSATAASSSASAASTSASNASTSATNAATSASTASTQASNAATSATSASNSATTATTQASNASTSATNAASSASAASTSATNAASSASAASSSASAAATSATNAAASYDSFDDRYLGSKTANPTLDNDGNALLTGALYWNSTATEMRVYTGSAWVTLSVGTLDGLTDVAITSPVTGNILRHNGTQFVNYPDSNYAAASHTHTIANVTNLQTSLDAKLDDSQASVFGLSLLDDADAAAARTTLGLVIGTNVQAYDADLNAIAALAGTSGFLKKTAANTWSLDTATYLTTNQTITLSGDLSGSGSTSISATIAAGSVTTTKLGGDITTAGKALLDDADAAAQRSTLGLGTAATSASTAFATAVHTHAISDVTNLQTSLNAKVNTSAIGSSVQAYDASLQSLSALGTTADRVPYTTAVDTWAETTLTSFARTLLAGSSAAAMLATLTIANASINVVRFTASNTYIPSANTKSILVFLTGAGGAGGSVAASSTVLGLASGGGGGAGGTLIFSMAAVPADTYQVVVGGQTATTAAGAAALPGTVSTFSRIISGSPVLIAQAGGGERGLGISATANGVALGGAGGTNTTPNATYVAATAFVSLPGRNGSQSDGVFAGNTTNLGKAASAEGGSSFWGASAGLVSGTASTTLGPANVNGPDGIAPGSGGAGGCSLKLSATGSRSATGGRGAAGICVIVEIKG